MCLISNYFVLHVLLLEYLNKYFCVANKLILIIGFPISVKLFLTSPKNRKKDSN